MAEVRIAVEAQDGTVGENIGNIAEALKKLDYVYKVETLAHAGTKCRFLVFARSEKLGDLFGLQPRIQQLLGVKKIIFAEHVTSTT